MPHRCRGLLNQTRECTKLCDVGRVWSSKAEGPARVKEQERKAGPAGTRLWRALPTARHLNSSHPVTPWTYNTLVVLNLNDMTFLEKNVLVKFLLCARKNDQWVNVHLKKKWLYVFTSSLLLKPPGQSFTFLAGSSNLQMTGRPEGLAHIFLGLLRFCSSDVHTTCLNPMLAEDSKIFGFNWRNVRKKKVLRNV